MLHRAATIAVSLAGLPFILPHVVEDFGEGIGPRVGLSTPAVAFLLGGFLALQWLGLVLVGQDRRAGWIITIGVGIIWTAGAVFDHGREIAAGDFRSGAVSRLWVVGLVVSQTVTATLAWRGWRRGRRP
ncbi:MAG TPA: hypothetical protein VGV13_12305 [Methylomirabilota bacterium]|jgi:hypothetical protein|nr:hypothetical protein [Methylomirabilota bacterium]